MARVPPVLGRRYLIIYNVLVFTAYLDSALLGLSAGVFITSNPDSKVKQHSLCLKLGLLELSYLLAITARTLFLDKELPGTRLLALALVLLPPLGRRPVLPKITPFTPSGLLSRSF